MTSAQTEAWKIVKAMRSGAWAMIDEAADNAIGTLDRFEASKLSAPIVGAGEWDWFHALNLVEQARIRRNWTSPTGEGPDVVAGAMGFGYSIDEAMVEWVRLTRIVDAAARMAARARKEPSFQPSADMLGGCTLDDLFPFTGYRLVELFAPQPVCVDYVDRYNAELEDEAGWSQADTVAYMAAAFADA